MTIFHKTHANPETKEVRKLTQEISLFDALSMIKETAQGRQTTHDITINTREKVRVVSKETGIITTAWIEDDSE